MESIVNSSTSVAQSIAKDKEDALLLAGRQLARMTKAEYKARLDVIIAEGDEEIARHYASVSGPPPYITRVRKDNLEDRLMIRRWKARRK